MTAMLRQALWATPCCGNVLFLFLGPRATLPRTWRRLECYCGKRYDFEPSSLVSFTPSSTPMPEGISDTDHWWSPPPEPIVAREPCNVKGCGEPCYIACRVFSAAGPQDVHFCKTHVQRVGTLVDTLVQSVIFSPSSNTP